MQFQNNRKKIFIILFVILVIFFIFLANIGKDNKSNTNDRTYYDPNSGETISDPVDKSVEKYGGDNQEIVYLGFSKLLETGTTFSQLETIKLQIKNFSDKNNLNIKEASIRVVDIRPVSNEIGDDDVENGVDFPLIVNRKDLYNIEIRYINLEDIKIKIFSNNNLIFENSITPSQPTINDDETEI